MNGVELSKLTIGLTGSADLLVELAYGAARRQRTRGRLGNPSDDQRYGGCTPRAGKVGPRRNPGSDFLRGKKQIYSISDDSVPASHAGCIEVLGRRAVSLPSHS